MPRCVVLDVTDYTLLYGRIMYRVVLRVATATQHVSRMM